MDIRRWFVTGQGHGSFLPSTFAWIPAMEAESAEVWAASVKLTSCSSAGREISWS
jgi:hypothetical protein